MSRKDHGDDLSDDELYALVGNSGLLDDAQLAELYAANKPTNKSEEDAEKVAKWLPSLSEKQMRVFFDEHQFLLLPSMRYTGKTYTVGHVIAKHCWDFDGAFVLVVAKSKRQMLRGGLIEKLVSMVLPSFAKNIRNFSHSGIKMTIEKDVVVTVTNRFGGTSVIQMMSVDSDLDLSSKIKSLETSLVVVDEITAYKTDAIFSELANTLRRKTHIPTKHQRFIAMCNPDDPEHWVAKTWNVLNPEERRPEFGVIEFKAEDNPEPVAQDYYAQLRVTLRNNPTKFARDVEGRWVAVPDGEALFADYFQPDVHIIGNMSTGFGWTPIKDHPVLLGLDLGEGVNHGVSFMQVVPTKEKTLWVVFDEFESVKKEVSLEQVTRKLMVKFNAWCARVGYAFSVTAVSDNSAFNRFRSGTGSFDYAEVERYWKKFRPEFSYIKHDLKILEAPKGDGSVAVRTRFVQDMLSRQELFFAATCPAHIKMLNKITGTKKTPMAPNTHDPLKHIYDSLSYPIVYYKATEGPVESEEEITKPQIIRAGYGKVA